MNPNEPNGLLNNWLTLTGIQASVNNRLESLLQSECGLSLKEFYVLYFLSLNDKKKLRLQQLQELVGLSQSAMSRLVGRLEAPKCRALRRHICEDDRRGVYTEMTELGENKFERALLAVNAALDEWVKQGELPEELKQLMLRDDLA